LRLRAGEEVTVMAAHDEVGEPGQATTEGTGDEVVDLALAWEMGRDRVGAKAFNLARLAAAGLPVPAGFVVTPGAFGDWDVAGPAVVAEAARLGADRYAVRSSAAAEDLPGASYAGMYESVLNVAPPDVTAAVQRVRESGTADRVAAYQQGLAGAARPAQAARIAVLVQVMVEAQAAGVAFTADPITGDHDEVLITAVRGLGERLVGGEAVGDEWVVRAGQARCRRSAEDAIDAGQARQVAELARRAEAHFGAPQDLEWAIAGGRVFLLQARPMTALPDPVTWIPPHGRWWLRNFRLGEWLPEPVTPLFAGWLLPVLEQGVARAMQAESGLAMRPAGAVINGWYYTTPPPRLDGAPVLQVLRHPRTLLAAPRVVLLLLHPERMPGELARMTRHWREELLPRYRKIVAAAQAAGTAAPPAELAGLIEQIGEVAGEYSWSVATLAGSQWKIEAALTRFCCAHLPGLGQSPQILVSGLTGTEPDLPPHALHSIDWYWPTAGELGIPGPGADVLNRHRELAARREAGESACRAALAGRPRLRRRFGRLLAIAQTYAVVREQQTRQFSLGWPVLRACVLRLGEELARHGAIGRATDVFFLTRAELQSALSGAPLPPPSEAVRDRRGRWEQQRRLIAPLQLGKAPAIGRRVYEKAIETARTGAPPPPGALAGDPASPGRATGQVRVILDPGDFDSFQPGEILVARATAPAWTPLFAKAAAVITDGGTLAAHASLVAREYGIPAVVATGDSTTRLHDGQIVTVDGGTGIVEIHEGGHDMTGEEHYRQPEDLTDRTDVIGALPFE
jgi:phosphohistidine swiveling domain-containing protein